jgi:hypothetical protein
MAMKITRVVNFLHILHHRNSYFGQRFRDWTPAIVFRQERILSDLIDRATPPPP